jgi:hypothetical protein
LSGVLACEGEAQRHQTSAKRRPTRHPRRLKHDVSAPSIKCNAVRVLGAHRPKVFANRHVLQEQMLLGAQEREGGGHAKQVGNALTSRPTWPHPLLPSLLLLLLLLLLPPATCESSTKTVATTQPRDSIALTMVYVTRPNDVGALAMDTLLPSDSHDRGTARAIHSVRLVSGCSHSSIHLKLMGMSICDDDA